MDAFNSLVAMIFLVEVEPEANFSKAGSLFEKEKKDIMLAARSIPGILIFIGLDLDSNMIITGFKSEYCIWIFGCFFLYEAK
jgi:hypothetical protein